MAYLFFRLVVGGVAFAEASADRTNGRPRKKKRQAMALRYVLPAQRFPWPRPQELSTCTALCRCTICLVPATSSMVVETPRLPGVEEEEEESSSSSGGDDSSSGEGEGEEEEGSSSEGDRPGEGEGHREERYVRVRLRVGVGVGVGFGFGGS